MAEPKFTGTIQFNGQPVNLYDGRPIDTASDVGANALQDAGDIFKGLGTLGGFAIARGAEAIPFYDKNVPLGRPLLRTDWIGTAPDIGDIGTIQQMGLGIVNNYKQAYIDPLLTGHPENLINQAKAHPLNTAFDVLPAAKMLGAGKAASAIGETAIVKNALAKTKSIAADALSSGAQKYTQAASAAQQSSNPIIKNAGNAADTLAEAANKARESIKGFNAASDIQKGFSEAMIAEDSQYLAEVGSAWRKIPRAMQGHVKAYAEGWHPELLAGAPIPDTVKNYLGIAEQYSAVMRNRISGMVDETAMALDKYQPATIQMSGMDSKAWQALSEQEQVAKLLETKALLDAKGITPQYSPHVQKFEMEGVTRDPARIQTKLADKNAGKQLALQHEIDALKQQGLTLRQELELVESAAEKVKLEDQLKTIHNSIRKKMEQKSGYLKTKQSSGSSAIDSHFDALRTRWIQIAQLHHAYDKVLKATIDKAQDLEWLKNTPDLAAKQMAEKVEAELLAKGLTKLDAHDMAKNILGGLPAAVASQEEIAKLINCSLPKEIYVNKAFASALKVFTLGVTPKNNGLSKLLRGYDEAVSLSKRYMLGGNFTYAEAQAVQQAAMLEFVSVNGPIDFIRSIMAWRLACDPKVRAAIPAHIAEDIITKEVTGRQYLKEAADWVVQKTGNSNNQMSKGLSGMVIAYDKYISMNLARAQIYDSFIRVKAGIFYGIKEAQAGTPLGQSLRDIFSTEKSIAAIEKTMADAAAMNQVNSEVLKACGNFRALSGSPTMRLLGRITPFPSWLVFISQYTAKLPTQNPYKWMITQQVGRLAEEYLADPFAPANLKGGVAMSFPGPNGGRQDMKKDAFNPLTSVGDIAAYAQQLFAGQGDKRIPSLLTAPLQLAFIATTRLNPLTLQDFKDPRLVQGQFGQQYKPVDVITGRVQRGEAQPERPMPDLLTLAMRQFFGPLERVLETVAEKAYSNGQRSQMSSLFASAPKRDSSTKQVKQTEDWPQLAIRLLINASPIEYTDRDRANELKGRYNASKALMKAVMRMGDH